MCPWLTSGFDAYYVIKIPNNSIGDALCVAHPFRFNRNGSKQQTRI